MTGTETHCIEVAETVPSGGCDQQSCKKTTTATTNRGEEDTEQRLIEVTSPKLISESHLSGSLFQHIKQQARKQSKYTVKTFS